MTKAYEKIKEGLEEVLAMIDLDELERLANAATPGEWVTLDGDRFFARGPNPAIPLTVFQFWTRPSPQDSAFIAAMNPVQTLALIKRVREAEAERDEAINWTGIVDRYGTDKFDTLAERWLRTEGIIRTRNAVTSVFVKWASEDIMERFRAHMDNAMQLAFVEGALCGVRAAEAAKIAGEG